LRGFNYHFNVNALGHPFWIKTSPTTGSENPYNNGVTNNGIQSGIITFAVPYDAPSTLYYACQIHPSMQGTINISDVGPVGAQGVQGAPGGGSGGEGVQGAQGFQGAGVQGAQGFQGAGVQGAIGAQGVQGAPGGGSGGEGVQGAQGFQGYQGVQGATGVTFRVVTLEDTSTITLNADTTDLGVQLNTQSAGTLTINGPTGTPNDGQKIMLRIRTSNVQTLNFNAIFQGSTDLNLPTSTSGSSKFDYMGFIYNSTLTKWQLLAKIFGF
jgi:hypothetical protein